MDAIEKLTELFTRFPGIGPRQARRFAYFILTQTYENYEALVSGMAQVRKDVAQCPMCFVYFTKKGTESLCLQCRDTTRSAQVLLVVEKDVDLQAIEKSKMYNGYYFVLGGTIPIHEEKPSSKVKVQDLIRVIHARKAQGLSEVIAALSATQEGDNTYAYLKNILNQHVPDLKVSILGRGLSTGTEIEYIDPSTFKEALHHRT